MLFAIVCAQNHMTKQEVMKECQAEKWIPILVMRPDKDNCVVPLFENCQIGHRFVERNLPKDWLYGVIPIDVQLDDLRKSVGWEVVVYSYPKKVQVEFDVEILEFGSEVEVKVHC